MDDDDIAAQLQGELRAETARALQSRRPVLTHLNADTTWLLSLPVPGSNSKLVGKKSRGRRKEDVEIRDGGDGETGEGEGERVRNGKAYFHILIDPWLRGSQSDVAQFFSQQWHAQESACQSIADVEDVIRGIEELASSQTASPTSASTSGLEEEAITLAASSVIDAVVVSHEFTDHMHRETLLEVPPSVPVLAFSKAASIIRSWKHFSSVQSLLALIPRSTDWRTTSVAPLPKWLGIGRLTKDGVDLLYYHSAVLVTFSSSLDPDRDEQAETEAVVYTPHGIMVEDLSPLAQSAPRVRTLALLHGLHDVRVSAGQLNLGAHNGLKAQRLLGAKYWIGTHDEVKRGGGLVSWFLKREVLTVREALEREMETVGKGPEKGEGGELEDVVFEDVGNGESLILR